MTAAAPRPATETASRHQRPEGSVARAVACPGLNIAGGTGLACGWANDTLTVVVEAPATIRLAVLAHRLDNRSWMRTQLYDLVGEVHEQLDVASIHVRRSLS